jgi:hypothetical protein
LVLPENPLRVKSFAPPSDISTLPNSLHPNSELVYRFSDIDREMRNNPVQSFLHSTHLNNPRHISTTPGQNRRRVEINGLRTEDVRPGWRRSHII